jgi:hypothetical protein
MLKTTIKEAINDECLFGYFTHEAEISNIKHDYVKQELSCVLTYDGWIKERHAKKGIFIKSLDVKFFGVTNLNSVLLKTSTDNGNVAHHILDSKPIETIKELLLGIHRIGENVVEIYIDNDFDHTTVIKFVAEHVEIKEKAI